MRTLKNEYEKVRKQFQQESVTMGDSEYLHYSKLFDKITAIVHDSNAADRSITWAFDTLRTMKKCLTLSSNSV